MGSFAGYFYGTLPAGQSDRGRHQGDYTKIYEANKGTIGSNPNLIKPGQKLVIP
nr:LysM peptidoglycan-binding domain-containing protein [Flavonifractor sp. An306]